MHLDGGLNFCAGIAPMPEVIRCPPFDHFKTFQDLARSGIVVACFPTLAIRISRIRTKLVRGEASGDRGKQVVGAQGTSAGLVNCRMHAP